MKAIIIITLFFSIAISNYAQTEVGNLKKGSEYLFARNDIQTDSLSQSEMFFQDSIMSKIVHLKEITLVGYKSNTDIQQMPEIVGTSIYAGKKSALIVMDNVQGNIVNNTMRQVVAKVPGIQIWESDGSGIQIGLGARGLSPNRSWEFNVRQNGYDIVADPFGYPEAYCNPQMQAVQRMEIVRGHAALQYGPQFGGLVNFILKNGAEIEKPVQFETQQTAGSNGLINIYTAIGGETKKFHYYSYYDHRNSSGWRDNSEYATDAGFGSFTYRFNDKLNLTGELMYSHILSQQPGGLTDAQLEQDARQSLRSRNWLDVKWTTASLIGNYVFNNNNNSRLNVKVFGVFADRSSIGYMKFITVKDSINPLTLQYDSRQVDQDLYNNLGIEARYLSDYFFKNRRNTFSAGVRYYNGKTDRFRLGVGDKGTEFNNTFLKKNQDLDLSTYNAAAFFENIFRINSKLSVIPGFRIEHIVMHANGRLNYDASDVAIMIKEETRTRNFVLGGIGAEYAITKGSKIYSNYSQAYRPMLFTDVSVSPQTEVVDPELADSKGSNFDLGYRGKLEEYFVFDVSWFLLQYNNRIGVIQQQKIDGSFYDFRTNVGESTSRGLEAMFEISPLRFPDKSSLINLRTFAAYSYTDARYGKFKVITVDKNTNSLKETSYKNNKVENAPEHIFRTGATAEYKSLSLTYQWSYVSKSYADANNTLSDKKAQVGVMPAYSVSDLSTGITLNEQVKIKAGINNLFDATYITRRASSIPGPGAMPSDGRSVYISVGAKF